MNLHTFCLTAMIPENPEPGEYEKLLPRGFTRFKVSSNYDTAVINLCQMQSNAREWINSWGFFRISAEILKKPTKFATTKCSLKAKALAFLLKKPIIHFNDPFLFTLLFIFY